MNAHVPALPVALPSRLPIFAEALAALRTGSAVFIEGDPGSGRTTFGAQLLVARRGEGRGVHRVTGYPALASVPFAALTAFGAQIPPRSTLDASPTAQLATLVERLERLPRTLFLDGAEHLDAASAASLAGLARLRDEDGAPLLELIVSTERLVTLSRDLQSFALEHGSHRLRLLGLRFDDAESLLEDLLGDPCNSSAVNRLLRLSGGNAMHLREVALDADAQDALPLVSGYRTLIADWSPRSGRASGLVSSRLAHQADGVREAVELIAVTGPLPRATALGLVDHLERAIDEGLLAEEANATATDIAQNFDGAGAISEVPRGEGLIHLGSGLTPELVLVSLPLARLRALVKQIREQVPRDGLTTDARIRLARHLRRLGTPIDLAQLREDAEAALAATRFDVVVAITEPGRDAELVPDIADVTTHGDLSAILLLRAKALFEIGEPENALSVLRPLLAGGVEESALLAARIESAGLGRSGAADHLAPFADGPDGGSAEAGALRTLLHAQAGGHVGVEELRIRSEDERVSAGLRLSLVAQTITELLHTGRPADGVALFAHHLGGDLWKHVSPIEQGELFQAMFLAMMGEGSALPSFDHHFEGVDWAALALDHASFLTGRGDIFLEAGDASEAASLFSQALALLSVRDQRHLSGLANGFDSVAASLVGDLDRAARRYEAFLAAPRSSGAYARAEVERLTLLTDLVLNGRSSALQRFERMAEDAERRCRSHLLMRVLHDGWRLRLVHATDERYGLGRLAVVAEGVQGSLARTLQSYFLAFAEEAGAPANHDGPTVEELAAAHLLAGRPLYAAEAAARGAELAQAAGNRGRASRLLDLFSEAVAPLANVNTPSLGRARVDPELLSEREYEVCVRAGSGLSNAEIADELFLSPRTVEGHLQRAYPKLGVSDRRQLIP